MGYYNQYDYAHVPYTHSARPQATVKTSGCGPCCISMAVEALGNKKYPPERSAAFAMSCGARLAGGTDMRILAQKTAERFGLKLTVTDSLFELASAVAGGGAAIANTGGDRKGYKGLFSNGGHFIFIKSASKGRFCVWDPGFYKGKFDKKGRKGRVEVMGRDILVRPSDLAEDCRTRRPAYYILEKRSDRYRSIEDVPQELRKEALELMDCGALRGEEGEKGLDLSRDMLRCIIVAKRYADLKS